MNGVQRNYEGERERGKEGRRDEGEREREREGRYNFD